MKIGNDKVVMIDYVLTDAEGTQLDASQGEPLAYMHGHHNLIPGLEKALEGKEVGEEFSITVPADEAYGAIHDHLIQKDVPKEMFQGVDNLEVGMQFQAQADNGQAHSVTISEVQDATVTVDGNHPLAGKDLTFDVKITGIRDATEEELEHGHAHGAGGHHH